MLDADCAEGAVVREEMAREEEAVVVDVHAQASNECFHIRDETARGNNKTKRGRGGMR